MRGQREYAEEIFVIDISEEMSWYSNEVSPTASREWEDLRW